MNKYCIILFINKIKLFRMYSQFKLLIERSILLMFFLGIIFYLCAIIELYKVSNFTVG